MHRIFTLLICFLPFLACSSSQSEQNETIDTTPTASRGTATVKDTFARAVILPHINCTADASQSYALYIPATAKTILLPLVFCFDPHGDGVLPLQQYKTLADTFGFILAGSNNSKNGNDWNTTQTILNALLTDAGKRVAFNHSRMYACGFSGGAKVAGYMALHQSGITGIITAGAGLPEEESLRSFPFSITAMTGRGDMNMTDLVAMNTALDQTSTVHRLVLFDGKHAWPPVDAMRTAFTALQFDAMRDHTSGRDNLLMNSYLADAKKQIGKEEAGHQWLQAEQSCALAVTLLMNLTGTDWFTQEQNTIKNNPAYAQQQQQTQQLLAQEEQIKQNFQQQFSQGDVSYWKQTIAGLQQQEKVNTPEGAMYQRLLAYLSLAFYSLSNRLITGNQNEAAQHFVMLYKLADATNPEAWYFSAILDARNGNAQAAENDLMQAISLGFTDMVRLRQQAEFHSSSLDLNLNDVEKKMKK